MRIEALRNYQRRNPKGSYFEGLPADVRARAHEILRRLIARRRAQGRPFPHWLLPIYVWQAKRLAQNPPTSAWGRSMQASRGGYGVQRKYAREGRNPTKKATFDRLCRQGHPDSARKFLESQREANPPRVEVSGNEPRTWQVFGRPGAPPMIVRVGGKPNRPLPLHP
jgi:hypothetical protein